MLMPHVDAFAQEVLLGWRAVDPLNLSHFVRPRFVRRQEKALSQKINELILLH